MLRIDLRVPHSPGELLRGADRLLALQCQLVEIHQRLRPDRELRVLPEDELALVLPLQLAHPFSQLPLETVEPRLHPSQLVLQPEDMLDAREVEPELGRQSLDQPQPLEILLGVEPRVAGGPLRLHEAPLLVDAERLRMHADEVGGDGDHVPALVVHHETVLSCS